MELNTHNERRLAVLQVDRITRFMNPLSEPTILIYVYKLGDAPEYMDDFYFYSTFCFQLWTVYISLFTTS